MIVVDRLIHSPIHTPVALTTPLPMPLQASNDLGTDVPEVVDQVAVARLYGEPLFQLPQDLYIPPDALEVFLEAFEGPLDLLLYLIRRQNFNILDIPMAELTRQYLGYVEEIRHRNLELAAEYLLMAAMLIEIKSRMLLPPKPSADGGEPEDPRAELVRRLVEFESMKRAAAALNALPWLGRDFWCAHASISAPLRVPQPLVSLTDVQEVWATVLARARLVQRHRITQEALSVRETMSHVLRQLHNQRFMAFEQLLHPTRGLAWVVVTFIAVLELAKESLVEITQAEAYAPIYLRLRGMTH
ncbi:MAG: ScpA family protein [Rhodoferax sp.]